MNFTFGVFEEDGEDVLISETDENWKNRSQTLHFSSENASEDFINGFICQLLGNFGDRLITEDIVFPDILQIFDTTWFFDVEPKEMLNMTNRPFFINAEDYQDFGVFLATNNCEEFIAGMTACMNELGRYIEPYFPEWTEWRIYTREEIPNYEDYEVCITINTIDCTLTKSRAFVKRDTDI